MVIKKIRSITYQVPHVQIYVRIRSTNCPFTNTLLLFFLDYKRSDLITFSIFTIDYLVLQVTKIYNVIKIRYQI